MKNVTEMLREFRSVEPQFDRWPAGNACGYDLAGFFKNSSDLDTRNATDGADPPWGVPEVRVAAWT